MLKRYITLLPALLYAAFAPLAVIEVPEPVAGFPLEWSVGVGALFFVVNAAILFVFSSREHRILNLLIACLMSCLFASSATPPLVGLANAPSGQEPEIMRLRLSAIEQVPQKHGHTHYVIKGVAINTMEAQSEQSFRISHGVYTAFAHEHVSPGSTVDMVLAKGQLGLSYVISLRAAPILESLQ